MKIKPNNLKKINSLYIHIPFCRNICPYCDFTKLIKQKCFEVPYMQELFSDIAKVKMEFEPFKTIYIGGGTPSCLEHENLINLLISLVDLRVKENYEFTIEANPEDIDEEFLKLINRYGVNRLSIGIQSIKENTLKGLSRKKIDFKNLINFIKKYIQNINLDFIYGLPGETIEDIKNDIKFIVEMDVPHVSIYSLTVSKGTTFYNQGVKPLEEDKDREIYNFIVDELERSGFIHYEISNFCKPGYQSKHNFNYWKDNEFLGIGLGSAGFLSKNRYKITSNISKYIRGERVDFKEEIDKDKELLEFLMLNLRTNEGVSLSEYKNRFGSDLLESQSETLKSLVDEGFLEINSDNIVLTKKGMSILDTIVLKLI